MPNLEGALLSDYRLLECISQGSVADVYRASTTSGEKYEVAVKLFRPSYAERAAFRTHFMDEAEKIGRFDHPQILPFLEYGEGEGLLYSVTPFMKGGTLDDLLSKVGGKFSAMQVLPIVRQLCNAVQYIHEHEVIHGNIKPSNVFVANDGRLLLADFGITRGYADGQQLLTKMDWSSVRYAAPEQSLGLLRRASDIYSLGALCFHLLSGSPVFTGPTPVEVLLKHVREEAPSVRSREPGISTEVDDVLHRALKKRCDDRYATALEFSRAFAAAVAVAPVSSLVARSANLTTRPLTRPLTSSLPNPQTPLPAVPVAKQPPASFPAPLRADSTSVISLPPELLQQTAPQLPALPEQRGHSGPLPTGRIVPRLPEEHIHSGPLSSRQTTPRLPAEHAHAEPRDRSDPSFAEPGLARPRNLDSGPRITRSLDPTGWSPLAQSVANKTSPVPTSAPRRQSPSTRKLQPEGEEPARINKRGLVLAILIVLLLILGLLGALLSSFFLPAPPSSSGARTGSIPVVYQVRELQ